MALIFDLESNGLLRALDRIHCLVGYDTETKTTYRFRNNDDEDTIVEGVKMLEAADLIAGHNVISFDIPAIKKVYPWFSPRGQIKDTLVLVRVTASDIRNYDGNLYKNGMIPSGLIGRHSLEAWGYRLGKHKGDYVKDMEAKGLDPWAAWNPDMEEYCALDVEVTTTLWENILQQGLHPTAEALEHEVHTVCAEMERNGFPFDRAEALKLVSRLEQDRDVLREKIVGEYGLRMRPERKIHVRPQWYDPDGVQRKKEMSGVFPRPNSEWHEDLSRPWWGEITTPKRSMKRKVGDQVREYTEGAPYCKGTLQEFNPGSRQQVVEILTSEHGWVPTEFTEGGSPSVDSGALKKLSETVPIAKDLDELFFVEKLLGQMVNGPQSWLNSYKEDTGCLHCYIDTGGTVTGRCTHSRPNLGQVPGVIAVASKFETHEEDGSKNKKLLNKDGTWKSWVPAVDGSIPFEVNNPALFGPDGKFYPEAYDFHGKLKKEGPLLGRVGEYGWECRSLFRVPDGWFQLGVDLSGIEFRALAHLTAEFDGGELVEVVLTGDIHAYNQSKTGIPTRDIVKRVLYGLLYGAGDYKLGITVKATASYSEAVSIGARLRAQLMEGLPALNEAMKKVKTEAARGFITGLDGRKIKVRSEHSALNTRLQSDAAIIAKRWVCLTRQNAGATGANCGWDGDFVMMAFVHDEIQMAAHPLFAKELAQICKDAAKTAGEEFGFRCPVDADAKLGYSWAQCH